jgi:type I restriction enzyme R subunit
MKRIGVNDETIQWEYELVERPLCEQLQGLGWQWIEGDTQVAEFTERESFREVFLKARLRKAIRELNLRDGKPWMDEARIDKAIKDLEGVAGHSLMEANQAVTELLLKGTVVDGLPDWEFGRPQPVRYIDFMEWQRNDFLVINQFKVELGSGRGHIIPDTVLFVNGLPLVVVECKSPGIETPIHQAIDQLLRYSNQRKELFPTLYTENEGVERLFHTNQLMIATDFFESRVATVGAPPEVYLEWADTSPVPLSTVAEETGVITLPDSLDEAARQLTAIGPEQGDRPGTPLFFREGKDKPEFASKSLHSQQVLVAGLLRPEHLLDLIRNFILFQQVAGRTRKVVARYQQFRAVHRAIHRLLEGKSRKSGAERDERGGLIWHTQGSGKSLTMVFLIRKMRMIAALKRFKIVVVTDRTDLQKQIGETAQLSGEAVRPTELAHRLLSETTPDIVLVMLQKYQNHDGKSDEESVEMTIVRKEKKPGKDSTVVDKEVTFSESLKVADFPVLNDSEEILILADEAHRGHTRTLRRNLLKALPNAAGIGFTGTPILGKDKRETREIFGDYLDRYLLRDAELDGATVPILYEGRTADGLVEQADQLDKVFLDLFRDYTERELAIIKAKYATDGDVMEAPLLIERKARDMIRHYASVVLPEGYKAQVVATSRKAVMTYLEKLAKARDELTAELEALPPEIFTLSEEDREKLEPESAFLLEIHPQLPRLKAMEFAAAFSGNHNDPESWRDWSDKAKQEAVVERFKRRWGEARTDKTDPLSMLVVMNMLLTGFDAPVEQVLYLDRKIVAHDLLQAIARVNRTFGRKRCGYVVDYVGVAKHLAKALEGYDTEDTAGAMIDIATELPALLDLRARAVGVFTSRGITDLRTEVPRCVELLADLKIRADFINKVRKFYQKLGTLEHRPEVPADVFRDAKLLGFINKVAANLYRDPALNLLGVADKVKALIDAHISARGIDPKIPPVAITDAEFEKILGAEKDAKGRAAQMKHAARYHIIRFSNQNPQFAKKMSERLEEILQRFKDDWDALERELRTLIDRLREGDRADFPDLDPDAQVPFVRMVLEECDPDNSWSEAQRSRALAATIDMVERIRQELRKAGFWKNKDMREVLTKALKRDLDDAGLATATAARELAQKLVELARENHESLVRL